MIGIIASSFLKPVISYPYVTDGLALNLDASDVNSYPGSGSTWYDLSGNGRHGTLNNGVGFSSNNGGAISMINTSPYDYISGTLNCNKTYYSVEFWLRPSSLSNYNQFMSFNTMGDWGAWAAHTSSLGKAYIGTSASSRFNGVFPYPYILNTWRHYVFTFDNGAAKFYINGVLSFSMTMALSTASSFTSYYLGQNTSGTINGLLPVFRVYSNKVLTQSEITQNFDVTKSRYGF